MNFAQSEEYLLSLGNEVEAMKLSLDNIRKLLTALGNPERKYLKVQVAGTNGKGSVCAFLNSICLDAGIRTGMFTSPHLVSVTERVKIGGVDISEDAFGNCSTRVRSVSERLIAEGILENVPTFFEQVTAIALLAFAEANIEIAILETGLGGRFDAVTAVNAEICAITRIDYDHQKYLGETIKEIAAEKAAIIRPETKVVIGEQKEKAMKVVLSRCQRFDLKPRFARDVSAIKGRNTTGRECAAFLIQNSTYSLPLVFPPVCLGLLGKHQIENAKTAILLAEFLKESFPILNENLAAGLENTHHPGRLEWIGNFLLDGAHNVGGAKALAAYLDEFVTKPITLIFGAMRDKSVKDIVAVLWPRAANIILTRPENPRALEPEELIALRPESMAESTIDLTRSISEAIDLARKVQDLDRTILVTGSLYLVGGARNLLTRESKED